MESVNQQRKKNDENVKQHEKKELIWINKLIRMNLTSKLIILLH